MTIPTIGVVIPTFEVKKHLSRCLPYIVGSPLKPRVLVIDSSSNDGTVEEAKALGAETHIVKKRQFNHGTTRELGRKLLGTDIVVMITPDAYAQDEHMLGRLVAPIVNGEASVAYARQIPRAGAGFFESFPREFNYPAESHIRSIEDRGKFGSYLIFCSDSCAAYANSALDSIGGFRPTISGEDTIAAAMLLWRGHKIAYVADAKVTHSHRYTLVQELRRHFDTGYYREQYRDVLCLGGVDEGYGSKFVMSLFWQLVRAKPWLIPYAVLNTGAKWAGYRLGRASLDWPLWCKRKLSYYDFYWISDEFLKAKVRAQTR
jgi:rhamnosyltransferase